MVEYVTTWGTRISETTFRNLCVQDPGFGLLARVGFGFLGRQDGVRTTMSYVGRRRDGNWSISMIGNVDDGTLMFDWWTNRHKYHYLPSETTLMARFEERLRRYRRP